MKSRSIATVALLSCIALLAVAACVPREETLTDAESREALDEALTSTASEALTYDTVEITTNFTIGAAVQDAAEELAGFVRSQIPCAEVAREEATLIVDYGTLDDACVWRGKTYAGVHMVTIMRNEPGVVEVSHAWQDFTNGKTTLNGTADVTWDANALTRRVVHDFEWEREGKTANGSGDRTQSLIDEDAGLAGGIQIDGTRDWSTARGDWHLDIDGVQVRGEDPIPQAGVYTLTNPDGKVLTLTFTRIDEDSIQADVEGGRKPRTFIVHRGGAVTESTDAAASEG